MAQSTELTRLQNHLATQQGTRAMSLRERKAARSAGADRNILLLDVSGSMAAYAEGHTRRIDALWTIVQELRSNNVGFRCATFSDVTKWAELVECPELEGGTNLADAFYFVRKIEPMQITVVTDGEPNDEQAALNAAQSIGCKVNVMFVGSPSDTHAKAFCAHLASLCGGSYGANSLATEQLQLEASESMTRLMLSANAASQQRDRAIQL